MRRYRLNFFIAAIGLLLASCEKKDIPVTLPEKGKAFTDRVDMGEDYSDQVFYDFDKGQISLISPVNSWDLAFEASPAGFHIFMNGGKDMWVYNTHETDINAVTTPPQIKSNGWAYDEPCGLPDSTGVGDWTKVNPKEVYIVKLNTAYFQDTFKKIVIVDYSASSYKMMYSDLRSNDVQTITIPKDDKYNYSYFCFDDGGKITYPEPAKDSWDIVFTRYRHIYHELKNFPYIVTGVLLNPYKTTAAPDSISGFDAISTEKITSYTFSNFRNTIGYDWKSFPISAAQAGATGGKYTVNKNKVYVLKTQRGQFWKLHFLDFYNSNGVKGSPTFEYERLQ